MGNNNYVYAQSRPQVVLGALDSAKTLTVSVEGFNTLVLDCDYTRSAGTALVFTFTGTSINTSNNYGLTTVNYTTGTITDGSFTYTGSASFSKRFIFSLSGFGITTTKDGNITVTVTCTSGAVGDLMTVTPHVAVTG